MKRRSRGITLVEMVWVMTVSAALLGTMGWVVARVVGVGALSHEHLSSMVAIERLSQQFRRDVHAATRVEHKLDAPELLQVFVGSDNPIEYRLTSEAVERVAVDSQGGTARHEQFELPGMKPSEWRVDQKRRIAELELGLLPANTSSEEPTGRFSLLARWGSDAPLAQEASGGAP